MKACRRWALPSNGGARRLPIPRPFRSVHAQGPGRCRSDARAPSRAQARCGRIRPVRHRRHARRQPRRKRGPGPALPGTSGSSSLSYFDNDEAMRTLRVFGTCYAARHPEDSLAFMATEPASQAEAELYRRMFRRDNQNCLGENTEIRMPVAFVRGAIVEGLYRNGTALAADLALAPPPPGTSIRTLSEAARCYTAGHRELVRTLIEQTQPGSRQELAALTEMAPDFFRCIPDTARGRRFDSAQIRYRLAEALYRMPAHLPLRPVRNRNAQGQGRRRRDRGAAGRDRAPGLRAGGQGDSALLLSRAARHRRQLPDVPGRGEAGAAQAAGELRAAGRRGAGDLHHHAGRQEGARGGDGVPADQPSARLPDLRPGRRMRPPGPGDGLWPRPQPLRREQARGHREIYGPGRQDVHDPLHPLHALRPLHASRSPGSRRSARSAAARIWRSPPISSRR